jgi:hypothetical protein
MWDTQRVLEVFEYPIKNKIQYINHNHAYRILQRSTDMPMWLHYNSNVELVYTQEEL